MYHPLQILADLLTLQVCYIIAHFYGLALLDDAVTLILVT